MLRGAFGAAIVIGVCAAASAQDTTGPSDSARFTFYRVQDYFLRLDVQTGRVSECSWSRSGWACKVAPDERSTLESEITRLVASNLALKKELLAHEIPLPAGVTPDPAVDESIIGRTRLPPVEFKSVSGYIGSVWRRVVGMMANLQRDILRKG